MNVHIKRKLKKKHKEIRNAHENSQMNTSDRANQCPEIGVSQVSDKIENGFVKNVRKALM